MLADDLSKLFCQNLVDLENMLIFPQFMLLNFGKLILIAEKSTKFHFASSAFAFAELENLF